MEMHSIVMHFGAIHAYWRWTLCTVKKWMHFHLASSSSISNPGRSGRAADRKPEWMVWWYLHAIETLSGLEPLNAHHWGPSPTFMAIGTYSHRTVVVAVGLGLGWDKTWKNKPVHLTPFGVILWQCGWLVMMMLDVGSRGRGGDTMENESVQIIIVCNFEWVLG